MGHYAKVENGVVTEVIVAQRDFIDTLPDASSWIKTSYNTRHGKHYEPDSSYSVESSDQSKALRKNFAGIGMIYDAERDAFYEPQPYPSWTLDEATCRWICPQERPTVEVVGIYWDEDVYDGGNGYGWVTPD